MAKLGKTVAVIFFVFALMSLSATKSYDLTPSYASEGENISILNFEVNSTGTNSRLENITLEYTGTAKIGNMTFVSSKNDSNMVSGVSNISDVFNLTTDEKINGTENITLEIGIKSNASANGDSIDLNVTSLEGENISFIGENFSNPQGKAIIDTEKPSLFPQNPKPDRNLSSSVSVEAVYNDSVSGIEVAEYLLINETGSQVTSKNNKPVSDSLNGSFDSEKVEDGGYKIHYRAVDSVGHETLIKRFETIDNTPPNVIPRQPKDKWVKGQISLNATWNDQTTSVKDTEYIILDNSGDVASTGKLNDTFNTTTLSGGKYTVNFTAQDFPNNIGYQAIDINVDNGVPSMSVFSPSRGDNITSVFWINSSNVDPPETLSSSIKDSFWRLKNSSGIQYRSSPISNQTVDSLNFRDGNYSIVYNTTDKVGHSVEKYVNITIDDIPPTLDVRKPQRFIETDNSFEVEALWMDETTGTRYASYEFINSSDITVESGALNSTIDASSYKSDNYTIKYITSDFAGNSLSRNINFTIDRIKPSVAFARPIQNANISSEMIVGAVRNDLLSGMNSSTFNLSNSTFNISESLNRTLDSSQFADGSYNISFSLKDNAGNEKLIERSLNVDNTRPNIWNLSLNDTSPSNNTIFRIRGKAKDYTSKIEMCRLNASSRRYSLGFNLTYDETTSSLNDTFSLDGKEGKFDLEVICKDFAGNSVSNSVLNYSDGSTGQYLLMDNESPHIENMSPANAVNRSEPAIDLEIRDISGVNSSVNYWFNGSNKSNFSLKRFQNDYNKTQYRLRHYPKNLSNGEEYWINLSVEDKIGHSGALSDISNSFKVDLISPKAGELALDNYNRREFVFLNWTSGSDSISKISDYKVYRNNSLVADTSDSYYNSTNAPEGYYNYRVSYLDEAGNSNITSNYTLVDYNGPFLGSKTDEIMFDSAGAELSTLVNFTVGDVSGIINQSINLTFQNSTYSLNNSRLNITSGRNLSKRLKGSFKADISESKDYNLSLRLSDRFRESSYNWIIETEVVSDDSDTASDSVDYSRDPVDYSRDPVDYSGSLGGGLNTEESDNGTLDDVGIFLPSSVPMLPGQRRDFAFMINNTLNKNLTFEVKLVSQFADQVPRKVRVSSGEKKIVKGRFRAFEKPLATYPAALVLNTDMGKIERKIDVRLISEQTFEQEGGVPGPYTDYNTSRDDKDSENLDEQESEVEKSENRSSENKTGVVESASSFISQNYQKFEGVYKVGNRLADTVETVRSSLKKGNLYSFLIIVISFTLITLGTIILLYLKKVDRLKLFSENNGDENQIS